MISKAAATRRQRGRNGVGTSRPGLIPQGLWGVSSGLTSRSLGPQAPPPPDRAPGAGALVHRQGHFQGGGDPAGEEGAGGRGRAWERGALAGPGGPVPKPPCRTCPSCEHSRVVLFCSTATGPVAVPALTIAPGPLLTVSPPG